MSFVIFNIYIYYNQRKSIKCSEVVNALVANVERIGEVLGNLDSLDMFTPAPRSSKEVANVERIGEVLSKY